MSKLKPNNFAVSMTGADTYLRVALETDVLSADPHQLIAMLFDGALSTLTSALAHTRSGHISDKGYAISKAITIIDSGLRAALNHKAGGELAERLEALYDYMGRRLLVANATNDGTIIEEVLRLLTELRLGWSDIAPGQPRSPRIASAMLSTDNKDLL